MQKLARPFFILIMFFSAFAYANEQGPLSIAEMVDIALQNNPETQSAWWRARQAAAATGSARSAYYPDVSIRASADHGRNYKFVNGPEVPYTNVGADLILSYLLLDMGERSANVAAAEAALTSSRLAE